MGSKVYAVYVGWPKCASTWFYEFCKLSPEIAVPKIKDTRYFSANFCRGFEWFYNQLDFTTTSSRPIEINHDYIFSNEVLMRMHDSNDKLKIIVFMRYPLDWLISEYTYVKAVGGVTCNFKEYLAQYTYAMQHCEYAGYLKRLYEIFPKERVHVAFVEDLASNADAFAVNLCSFLSIDTSFLAGFKAADKVNKRMEPRWKIVSSITRLAKYTFLGLGLDSVYGRIKFGPIRRVLFSDSIKKEQVDEHDIIHLLPWASEKRSELESLLGYSLNEWRLKEDNFRKIKK